MSVSIVHLDQLTKQYASAGKPAIDNFSLDIPEGSVFGLLGPNGAGKSTTVMIVCGLMRPDSGVATVMGHNVTEEGDLIRQKIGVAPQEIALFPGLTAYENLYYFGTMYGLKPKFIRAQIKKYLHIFHLQEKKHKLVNTFSGGMKRRLNLMTAILHQPQLIILDEPTAGVDVQSRNLILDFLTYLKHEGTTIIYSSHVLEEAERICTHLGIMDEGKVIATGTKGALMEQNQDCANLEQLFIKLTGRNIRD